MRAVALYQLSLFPSVNLSQCQCKVNMAQCQLVNLAQCQPAVNLAQCQVSKLESADIKTRSPRSPTGRPHSYNTFNFNLLSAPYSDFILQKIKVKQLCVKTVITEITPIFMIIMGRNRRRTKRHLLDIWPGTHNAFVLLQQPG